MLRALVAALLASACLPILVRAQVAPPGPGVAVGPEYDSAHVYVPAADFDRFVASAHATFGGTTTTKGVVTVTPTASTTYNQIVATPYGLFSVFGFTSPIPYPFGAERTGYLVTDMDVAVASARTAGADIVVSPFPDPIGRDAIVRWPGGVGMQLYWHTTAPHYAALQTVPENRVYLSPDAVDAFVASFDRFSGGHLVSDDAQASGAEIGLPGKSFRRVRLESNFGKVTALVTDGHLPWPYGREQIGIEVPDLDAMLARATASGATVIVQPYKSDGRRAAMVQFPGGYIVEVHATV
jgi:predicted enzyme related to lactoylglutathione lyase